ncbi:MAG: (d)CMP kinase [Bdellovibrio sp.]|nr:(d)CMP kinase [Bdellovibrio sp.]
MGIPKLGPVIAIDGPAGTGKSSATRRLAEILGFVHVDTGALYRAIALLCREKETTFPDLNEAELATQLSKEVHLEFKRIEGKNPANRIFANGRDVTDFIRTPEVSMAASRISAIPDVRSALLGLQRRLGCAGPSILEGRDIGTVIFPDADVKFFLTATADERAKRRLIELEAAGSDAPSFEEVRSQILARDHGDSTRKVAPLKKAADAVELDTSDFTLDEVVKFMEKAVKKALTHGKAKKSSTGAK